MGTVAATGWAEWMLVAGGWALLAVGAALLLWALFWDRSRGRKRCPKCWYDMSGAVARREEEDGRGVFTCPECGRRVTGGERGLRRTRRRWGWVAFALLLLFVGADARYVRPRIAREGWLAVLPSSVLVFVCPIEGRSMPRSPYATLDLLNPLPGSYASLVCERRKKGPFWAWQDVVWMRRVFAAHPDEALFMAWVPKH